MQAWPRIAVAWAGILLANTFCHAANPLPVFPGAEGAGAYAFGGRGGDVIFVTNLNSS